MRLTPGPSPGPRCWTALPAAPAPAADRGLPGRRRAACRDHRTWLPRHLRTIYRYLQPLRTGTAPAALTPTSLKIGEVTSWLLRRAEDLNPRQQQLLTDLRGHCAQLDRLAEHVTSFAKMMTKRTGEQQLASWLERVEADDQPELHTFAAGIRLHPVPAGRRVKLQHLHPPSP